MVLSVKFFLISDNVDTQMGMRLAGIEGVVVHEKQEVEQEIYKAIHNDEIGIILITQKLMILCEEYIYNYKLNKKKPLIIEIPDRHATTNIGTTISKYVENAIGIKL